MGDGAAAARSVHLSETAFERVRAEDEPEWARFIDPAYLNGEYAHTFRDLERPEEAAYFAGLSIAEAERQNRASRIDGASSTGTCGDRLAGSGRRRVRRHGGCQARGNREVATIGRGCGGFAGSAPPSLRFTSCPRFHGCLRRIASINESAQLTMGYLDLQVNDDHIEGLTCFNLGHSPNSQ